MVNVEVRDCDTAQAVPLQCPARRDGHVVEQAKAHRPVPFRVVARGTNRTEGMVSLAVQYPPNALDCRAGRMMCREDRVLIDTGVGVHCDANAGPRLCGMNRVHVCAGVGTRQVLVRRCRWILETFQSRKVLQRGIDGGQALRALRVSGSRIVKSAGGVGDVQGSRHGLRPLLAGHDMRRASA